MGLSSIESIDISSNKNYLVISDSALGVRLLDIKDLENIVLLQILQE